jgi:arylsulfate sulfotransferase
MHSLPLALVAFVLLLALGCGTNAPDSPGVYSTLNPLVARYIVNAHQTGDVQVDFGMDTSYGRSTAAYPVTPGYSFPILVAGMKPSTTYHMRAKIMSNGTALWTDEDRVFKTGAIGPNLPPAIRVSNPGGSATAQSSGVELVMFSSSVPGTKNLSTFVTDRQGNVIWYYVTPDLNGVSVIKPMPNGHMLLGIHTGTDPISLGEIREITLAGDTVRTLSSTSLQAQLQQLGCNCNFVFFHHDFVPLANGHTIVLGQSRKDFVNLPGYPGTTTVQGDMLVDLDENWQPVWFWSTFDHLDVNRHLFGLPDWTHSNAVLYNPEDGNLLLSVRDQSWLLYIDYKNGSGSGDILWRLGNQGEFTLNTSDPGKWFYAQHFPSFISINGSQISVAVFDNGNFRLDSTGTACGIGAAPCYSRAAIFHLDQITMQAELLWEYLPGFFSSWGGAINQLPNGNVEFQMSQPFSPPRVGSRVMEVTQTTPAEVVWQMDIGGGFAYRAYRIPSLYPNVTWP